MADTNLAPKQDAGTHERWLRVDACVHPTLKDPEQIRKYMREPWRRMTFSGSVDSDYVGPRSQFAVQGLDGQLPGSDAARMLDTVVTQHRMDNVVLVPRTRGLLPDIDLSSEICSATNQWLLEEWLAVDETGVFTGTIRVDPRDVELAIAEIGKYAGDSRFVQVGVTTQTHAPLGHRQYEPLWSTLTETGLPLAVCADPSNNGVQFPVTLAGTPRYQIQKEVLAPSNFAFHLASLLAEGVLERHPGLKVIFVDGGHDLLAPLMWRLDKDWRPQRPEVPWVRRSPWEYLPEHIRFVTDALAGPEDFETWAYWLELSSAPNLLMYGSRYPGWNMVDAEAVLRGHEPEWGPRILGKNAQDLYGFVS